MIVNKDTAQFYRWMIVENCITLICTVLGCWLVSLWFVLLLFNLNYIKKSKE